MGADNVYYMWGWNRWPVSKLEFNHIEASQ